MKNVHFVIPAYNSESTICKCIKSALNQKGINAFVIVVDHDSSDNTNILINKNFSKDRRVTILKLKKNLNDFLSPSKPLNLAFTHLNKINQINIENWFIRLDSDDFIADDITIGKILDNNSNFHLIHAKLTFFEISTNQSFEYGPKIKFQHKSGMLKKGAYAAAHHAIIIRGDLLQKFNSFPNPYIENISYGEDLEFTLQLFSFVEESKTLFLDKSILYKSLHSDSITESATKMEIWRSMKHIFKMHKNFSRILLVFLFFDLCFRSELKIFKLLRKFFGYPGLKVGEIKNSSIECVIRRSKFLEDLKIKTKYENTR